MMLYLVTILCCKFKKVLLTKLIMQQLASNLILLAITLCLWIKFYCNASTVCKAGKTETLDLCQKAP